MTWPPAWVFGYGSLALHGDAVPARLHGVVRDWGVAMDNSVDLPGYKRYRTRGGGRPAVHVCFLDVADRPGASVNGVCLPVDAAALAALDDRERNYDRIEVTDRVRTAAGAPALDGAPVYTYVGSAAGRARFRAGIAQGTAVIDGGYRDAVLAGFAALGDADLREAEPSLEPGGLPVLELVREEIAPGSPGSPG